MLSGERSFLPDFDRLYLPKLAHRSHTFRQIFELLEQKLDKEYLIVETGCTRVPNNWAGDGQSSVLWDAFVNFHSGSVISVDIDPEHCQMAHSLVSDRATIVCQDSVPFLWNLKTDREIDLVYLDSFDVDFGNMHPSSMHHMKEFLAVINKLRAGALIVVDDNFPNGVGKGAYVREFMRHIGREPDIDGYQIGWVL